jgi:nitroimidazol reductase NimA-like FMN-containing flavoprotein (pyridoxamine 5'-phosphate oxidase superfamily)
MTGSFLPTERTTVRRLPQRGHYDKAQVFAILDEGFLCHVGFCVDDQPYVIPTLYARHGESIYLHGSAASRTLRAMEKGIAVCATVTLVDGLVLARSAFHHSMNYRSVVVLGTATLVSDEAEKLQALQLFTDHVVPGRWSEVRPPTAQELKGTSVLKLPLAEASAKVRSGPPIDDEEDYALPVWAGVVPLFMRAELPVPDRPLQQNVTAFVTERLAGRGVRS